MDERNVRYPAGPNGEGSTHRVGLTRHCLTSGLIQLPFALRNSLPEGALLVHDVQRDEQVDVAFVPPRQLAGLADFFVAHDLQVNDEIELRITPGDPPHVRMLPVRRARPTPSATGDAETREVDSDALAASASEAAAAPSGSPARALPKRTASIWRSYRDEPMTAPSTEASHAPAAPSSVAPSPGGPVAAPSHDPDHDPEVVETFGTVTVRRLGTGRFRQPPASDLAHDVPMPAESGATGSADDDRPDAVLGIDPDDALSASATDVAGEDGPSSDSASPDRASDPLDLSALGTDDWTDPWTGRWDDAPLVTGHDDPATAGAADESPVDGALVDGALADESPTSDSVSVRQASLFDVAPDAAPARPTSQPPARPKARPMAQPTPRPAVARAQPSPRTERPSAPAPSRSQAPDRASAQRAREEALSRAGDLRSRIIRWMLAPDTPVIVSVERVQHAFDLEVDVARDIVDGILESPPPSLKLTRLRTDLLRVSRITVEHDA